jgi:Flp pilus assembly pilin Flp
MRLITKKLRDEEYGQTLIEYTLLLMILAVLAAGFSLQGRTSLKGM